MIHYHVGTNIPGYLPEGDVYAVEDWAGALNVWKEELQKLVDDEWEDRCLSSHDVPKQYESCLAGGEERCDWRELVVQVEADKQGEYTSGEELAVIYDTPEGPDIAVWLRSCAETDCVMTWDEN